MPSQRLRVTNSWAAYQVDNAVTFVGITIDNAKEERVNRGDARRPDYRPKYTLEQILATGFRLPNPSQTMLGTPVGSPGMGDGVATVLAMVGEPHGLVKQYRYVGLPPEKSS